MLEAIGIWYSLETVFAISQVFPVLLLRIFQSEDLGQTGSVKLGFIKRLHSTEIVIEICLDSDNTSCVLLMSDVFAVILWSMNTGRISFLDHRGVFRVQSNIYDVANLQTAKPLTIFK